MLLRGLSPESRWQLALQHDAQAPTSGEDMTPEERDEALFAMVGRPPEAVG